MIQKYELEAAVRNDTQQQLEAAQKATDEAKVQYDVLKDQFQLSEDEVFNQERLWNEQQNSKTAKELEYEFMTKAFEVQEEKNKSEIAYFESATLLADANAKVEDADLQLQLAQFDEASAAAAREALALAQSELELAKAANNAATSKYTASVSAAQDADTALAKKKTSAASIAAQQENVTKQFELALKTQAEAAAALVNNEKPFEEYVRQLRKKAATSKSKAESAKNMFKNMQATVRDLQQQAHEAQAQALAQVGAKKAFEEKAALLMKKAEAAEKDAMKLSADADLFTYAAELHRQNADNEQRHIKQLNELVYEKKKDADMAIIHFTREAAEKFVHDIMYAERTAFRHQQATELALAAAKARKDEQEHRKKLNDQKHAQLTTLIGQQSTKLLGGASNATQALINQMQAKLDRVNFAREQDSRALADLQSEVAAAEENFAKAQEAAKELDRKLRDANVLKTKLIDEANSAHNESLHLQDVSKKLKKLETKIEVREIKNQLIEVDLDADLARVQMILDVQKAILNIDKGNENLGDFVAQLEDEITELKQIHNRISYLYGLVQRKDHVWLFIKTQEANQQAALLAEKREHVSKLTEKLFHNTTGSFTVDAVTPQDLTQIEKEAVEFNADFIKNRNDRAVLKAEIREQTAKQERILTEIYFDNSRWVQSFEAKMKLGIPKTCKANEVVFLSKLGPQIVQNAEQESCAQDPFYKTIIENKEKQKCVVELPGDGDMRSSFLKNCLGGYYLYETS